MKCAYGMMSLLICLAARISVAGQPPITFETPRGGEVFVSGQTYLIRLGQRTRPKQIDIELSTDQGATFSKIGTINNLVKDRNLRNVFKWEAPLAHSGRCMLRAVAMTRGGTINMLSPVFSINFGSTTTLGAGALPELADGSVTNAKLAAGAVTDDKVDSGASSTGFVLSSTGDGKAAWVPVASALGPGSVSSSQLATGAVSSDKIADSAVTTTKIADGSVTTAKLADGSVTSDKLAPTGVTVGSYIRTNLTVNEQGQITAAASSAPVTNAEVATNAAIDGIKIVPDFGVQNVSASGNLTLTAAGNKLCIKEGANASMGLATLALGSVTVANTLVTANTRIFLTAQAGSLNLGAVSVSARTPGVSFTISSSSLLDSRDVGYILIEPAP